jgi:hypothetical protein
LIRLTKAFPGRHAIPLPCLKQEIGTENSGQASLPGRNSARQEICPEFLALNLEDTMATRTDLANAIRALAMDAVEKAKSGHPGAPMGMAEISEVLGTTATASCCPTATAPC